MAAIINAADKINSNPYHILLFYAILIAFTSLIASILLAVRVMLPKTFDEESPMHTSGIVISKFDEYMKYCSTISYNDVLSHVLRENHVVSRIIEFKSTLVRYSAAALFLGIAVSFVEFLVYFTTVKSSGFLSAIH